MPKKYFTTRISIPMNSQLNLAEFDHDFKDGTTNHGTRMDYESPEAAFSQVGNIRFHNGEQYVPVVLGYEEDSQDPSKINISEIHARGENSHFFSSPIPLYIMPSKIGDPLSALDHFDNKTSVAFYKNELTETQKNEMSELPNAARDALIAGADSRRSTIKKDFPQIIANVEKQIEQLEMHVRIGKMRLNEVDYDKNYFQSVEAELKIAKTQLNQMKDQLKNIDSFTDDFKDHLTSKKRAYTEKISNFLKSTFIGEIFKALKIELPSLQKERKKLNDHHDNFHELKNNINQSVKNADEKFKALNKPYVEALGKRQTERVTQALQAKKAAEHSTTTQIHSTLYDKEKRQSLKQSLQAKRSNPDHSASAKVNLESASPTKQNQTISTSQKKIKKEEKREKKSQQRHSR